MAPAGDTGASETGAFSSTPTAPVRERRRRRFEILCTTAELLQIKARGARITGNPRKTKAWARSLLLGRRTAAADAGAVPRARVIAFAEQVLRWAERGDTAKIERLAGTVLDALHAADPVRE